MNDAEQMYKDSRFEGTARNLDVGGNAMAIYIFLESWKFHSWEDIYRKIPQCGFFSQGGFSFSRYVL